MFTPLGGVGLYLAQSGNIVALASWEGILGDYLAASGWKSDKTLGGTSQALKEELSKGMPAALLYVNFERLGAIVEAAGGNLAMFTGGKSPVPADKIGELKKIGRIVLSVRYKDHRFSLLNRYEPGNVQ